jgi:hypothetical protein
LGGGWFIQPSFVYLGTNKKIKVMNENIKELVVEFAEALDESVVIALFDELKAEDKPFAKEALLRYLSKYLPV